MVRELDDESFLDELFELASERRAAGQPLRPDEYLEQRPHLRERILEAFQVTERVAVQHSPRPLPEVEGYEILKELGHGAMGTVYLARQLALGGRRVALKVLPAPFAPSPRVRARFLGEVRALAKLRHPNVVAVHDVVERGGVLAYAMDWIEGRTLAEVIAHLNEVEGKADIEVLRTFLGASSLSAEGLVPFYVQTGVQIARALDEVHRLELLHRDVKPSNILIRTDGTALLSDFGLVRAEDSSLHTQTGEFLGTPAYSAPEQLEGRREAIDARSDVYGLGATLYHAFTGRLPFPGRSAHEILLRVHEGFCDPIRRIDPKLPRELETIVSKAMDADRERRYASASALADDLERFQKGRPILARPASAFYQFRKLVGRHKAPFALLALLFVALAGFAVTMAVLRGRLAEQAARILAQKVEIEGEKDKALAAGAQAVAEAEKARVQARKAERVSQFIQGIFGAVNPEEGGHDVRVHELLDAAADRLEAELGVEPEVAAAVRYTLGRGYLAVGDYVRAKELLEEAASAFRSFGDAGLNGLISALCSWGEARIALGEGSSAKGPLEEALAIGTRLHGERSGRVAECRVALANWHLSEGRFAEAEAGYRIALSIQEELGEPDELELASILQDLAVVLFLRGNAQESERLLRRALVVCEHAAGRKRVGFAEIQMNLANLLMAKGELDEAEELLREASETTRAKRGPEHKQVAQVDNNRAWLLSKRGQHAQAERLSREATEALKQHLGPRHPDVGAALVILTRILCARGRGQAAVEVGSEAVAILRAQQPPNRAKLASALVELAGARFSQGQLEASRAEYEEALAIKRVELSPGHFDLFAALHGLGLIHLQLGGAEAAVPVFEEALEIRRKHPEGDLREVAYSESMLAIALAQTGRMAEAEELFLAALEKVPDEDPSILSREELLHNLVTLYENWGKPEEAERYRALLH